MSAMTSESAVEQGRIHLNLGVRHEDYTKVLVIVPDFEAQGTRHMMSPRLVYREQRAGFDMEVIEGTGQY